MKRLAYMTLVRDDREVLPKWLEYYGRLDADLVVLDHGSADMSTARITSDRVRVIQVAGSGTIEWQEHQLDRERRELLEIYERVVVTRPDEFLVADPAWYTDLGTYLECTGGDALTARVFDLCTMPEAAPLDLTVPVLSQRYWRDTALCRTVATSKPVYGWPPPDPHLFLVRINLPHRSGHDPELCRAEPIPVRFRQLV